MINLTEIQLWKPSRPVTTNATQTLDRDQSFSSYSHLLVRTSIVESGQTSLGPVSAHLVAVEDFQSRDVYLGMGRFGCRLVHLGDNTFNRISDGPEIGVESIHGVQIPGNVLTDDDKDAVDHIADYARTDTTTKLPVSRLPDIPRENLPTDAVVPKGSAANSGSFVGYNAEGDPIIASVPATSGAHDIAAIIQALRDAGATTGDYLIIGAHNNITPRHIKLDLDWSPAFDAAYRAGEIPEENFNDDGFTYLTYTKPSS